MSHIHREVPKDANEIFFEKMKKTLDKREKMVYNIRVKQSRALRSHPYTGCDMG